LNTLQTSAIDELAQARIRRQLRKVAPAAAPGAREDDAPPEESRTAATPEQLLWVAVIERAFYDTSGPDVARAIAARHWLLEEPDFLLVADYAGVRDPEALREILAAVIHIGERHRAPRRIADAERRPRAGRYVRGPGCRYGHIVHALRARLGVNGAQMAREMGISQGHICGIERGRRPVSPALLAATIAYFRARGIDTRELEKAYGIRAERWTILTAPPGLPLAA
jgi:DNA-binding XRE family transcriptional regulator